MKNHENGNGTQTQKAVKSRIASIRRNISLLRSEMYHFLNEDKFNSQFDQLESAIFGLEATIPNIAEEVERLSGEQYHETLRSHAETALIAKSYHQIVESEIESRAANLPNGMDELEKHNSETELLVLLSGGYKKIANRLEDVNQELTDGYYDVQKSLMIQIKKSILDWAEKHGTENLQSAMQIPMIALGVYALTFAGAPLLGSLAISSAVVAPDKLSGIISKIKIGS